MVHPICHAFRKLPNWVESAVVLGAVFGVNIGLHFFNGASPDLDAMPVRFDDDLLLNLVIWEIVIIALIGGFLTIRDWTLKDIPLTFSWRLTKSGLKLFLLTWLSYCLGAFLLAAVFPAMESSARNLKFEVHVTFWMVVVVSIGNSLFEELTTVLYVFRRLEWAHPSVFLLTSAALRAMVHAYQGGLAMSSIFILGIIFARWFQKQRQLWPLFVAHALFDFIGLLFGG